MGPSVNVIYWTAFLLIRFHVADKNQANQEETVGILSSLVYRGCNY